MNIERHPGRNRQPRNRQSWIALLAVLSAVHPVFLDGQTSPPLTLWLPYADGSSAQCGQGAMSTGTHRDLHAWDFVLAEGEAVVAAAPGRVIRVTDNRRTTGTNDFDQSNHIFVDIGDGRFVTYTHHKAGTARVRPGDIVAVGTRLADVGKTGTIQPHIHVDVRGPTWFESHPARFRVSSEGTAEVVTGRTYRSVTPQARRERRFDDSVLRGDEFRANGVELEPGRPAFRIPLEEEVVFRGRVLEDATRVWIQVWRDGSRASDYTASTVPEGDGRFALPVRIPPTARASTWYRIMISSKDGSARSTATLPLMVG